MYGMYGSQSILVLAAMAIATVAAQGQQAGDVQKGSLLAREVCAECHAVERQDRPSPNPSSPTFATVAGTPGMSEAALNAILHTSHRSMPNIVLDPAQTADVTAYILSLKK
jgi:mono/diheme cytochrome c family protein